MSNPLSMHSTARMRPLKRKLDVLTEASSTLQTEYIGKTRAAKSMDTTKSKRIKLCARDQLAMLSHRRIPISRIKFPEKGPQDGGAYADVTVATLAWERTGKVTHRSRKVAVKKVRIVINGDMTEEKFLRVFANELSVLDKLSHPNIVKIIGFVEDIENRIAWLVFPWEDNGNLREFLRSGEWELPERVSLIRDVALGLQYLHSRQPPICHGDLKSLNVLVNLANCAVITDFGSARIIRDAQGPSDNPRLHRVDSAIHVTPEHNRSPQFIITGPNVLTLTGPACSFRWAPPEVIMGKSLDLASDVWALGWIAWETITDCYPFEELNLELHITMRIVEGRLPSIHDHDQLSQIRNLCDIMQSCWNPEPRERPSASQCCQSLGWIPHVIPVAKNRDQPEIQEAIVLLQTGEIHRLQSRPEEALRKYEEGLAISRETGDRTTEAHLLVGLADVHRECSRYAEAEASCTQALAICSAYDLGRANALLALGDVQRERCKYTEAERSYYKAVDRYTHVGNQGGEANALLGLGDALRERSKLVEAEHSYTRALLIYTDMGDRLGRANALGGLGDVQRARSRFTAAECSYTQALDTSTSDWDSLGRANALVGLGHVRRELSRHIEAEASYSQALALYESIGDDVGRANVLDELGDTHRERCEYVRAQTSYSQALAIYDSIGNDLGRANALNGLGEAQKALFNYGGAVESYSRALSIYETIGSDIGLANSSLGLSGVLLCQARHAEAKALINAAAGISDRIHYKWGQEASKDLLEEVLEAERSSTDLQPLPQALPANP